MNKKIIWLFIIFLLLGFGSYFFYKKGENTSLVLNSGEYDFRLEPQPNDKLIIRNFLIFYDYKNNMGNISFEAEESILGKIENLVLRIPLELETYDHLIEDYNQKWEENKDYNLSVEYQNNFLTITFHNFKNSLNDTKFTIFIRGNKTNGLFLPNGLFRSESDAARTWGFGSKNSIFILDLGDYRCQSYCFAEQLDVIIEVINNRIEINQPRDYYENAGPLTNPKWLGQRFRINTIDSNKERKKNFYYTISISLFVSALTFFANGLLNLFLFNKKKKYK